MANEQLDSSLSEYFAECEELMQRVSNELRAIEKSEGDVHDIDSLYRDIHTLKGAAQLFGFRQISEVSHAMESSLEPIRSQQLKCPQAHVDGLVRGLDVIQLLNRSIRETGSEANMQLEVENILNYLLAKNETPIIETRSSAEASQIFEAADSTSSIRVSVTLLDKLMNLMGEMVLVRNQVLQYASQSDHLEFVNLSQRLDVVTSEIQGEVMKTRMQPIGGILSKFHRVTRELAKELNKKIDLRLTGVETELDKTLLEAVKDPIMHIVRNSCDHGIETADERRALGKDVQGTIQIRSFHEGGQVIVEISDDGRGLSRENIIAKALEKNLLSPEAANTLSEREAFSLIFAPGFSTASTVTNFSGRGVGMDVVKRNIESIGGFVEIQSQKNLGTTTRLKIPLTLAIVPAMIVRFANERFAIPQVKLVELLRVETSDPQQKIETLHGKPVFRLRGNILPLISLGSVLRIDNAAMSAPEVSNIVVLNAEGLLFGLVVDEVLDTAEVVVKPLSQFVKSLQIYSGATVLGDGSVALILDITGIAKRESLHQESNSKVKSGSVDAAAVLSDEQEFLLFKLATQARHAVPLNLVHRLEEFPRSSVEYSGAQRFVRYRNSALPIFSLNEFLGLPTSDASASLSIIVMQRGGRMFGVEVDEIYDALKTSSELDESSVHREGIFGHVVTNEELIVVVDALHLLQIMTNKFGPKNPPVATKVEAPVDGRKRREKILLVEDTVFFRRHVTRVLESAGFNVQQCENGEEALRLLERGADAEIKLILSDIEMPRMNGLELATNLKKSERWRSIPLIALTTKFGEPQVAEGLAAGFDAYLEKLQAEVLLAEIDRLLSKTPMKEVS